MANVIYQLTLENLPDGVLRIAQERAAAGDGQQFSIEQIDMLIGYLRRCRADAVKISGDSVISDCGGSPGPKSQKTQWREEQQNSSKSNWRNRTP